MHLKSRAILLRFRILAALLVVANFGCASLKNPAQTIKIATLPAGAHIIIDGDIVGDTPTFIEVPKRKKFKLGIEMPGYEGKEVSLKPRYRWADSFFSNLIFLAYAPIGWGIDLLTQKAWEYEPVPFITLERKAETKISEVEKKEMLEGRNTKLTNVLTEEDVVSREDTKIAIAPPQASGEIISDELGDKLEEKIRHWYPKEQVLPYSDQISTFYNFEYLYDNMVAPEMRDKLYFSLKATHVVESKVTEDPLGNAYIHSKLINVFNDKTEDTFDWSVKADELPIHSKDKWTRRMMSLVSIVPNTVSFDTGSASANIFVDGTGTTSQTARYYSVSEKPQNLISIIAGVGFTNSKNPALVTHTDFTFRFVPRLGIYYDYFRFLTDSAQPNELEGTEFRWYILEAGVGPEFGIESSIGHQYLQFIPIYGVNWIQWDLYGSTQNSFKGEFGLDVELGWSLFISEHFNLRVFSRDLFISGEQWGSVLSQDVGRSVVINTQGQITIGIALGYYFPEGRNYLREWVRK